MVLTIDWSGKADFFGKYDKFAVPKTAERVHYCTDQFVVYDGSYFNSVNQVVKTDNSFGYSSIYFTATVIHDFMDNQPYCLKGF